MTVYFSGCLVMLMLIIWGSLKSARRRCNSKWRILLQWGAAAVLILGSWPMVAVCLFDIYLDPK